MPRRPALSRILIVVLLLLVLSVPIARAAEPASPRTHGAAGSLSLVDLLGRAWGGLVSLWLDNGCGIDPDGRCAAGPIRRPTTDNGCGIDPSGRCAAVPVLRPSTDNGCIADPNGRCRTGS